MLQYYSARLAFSKFEPSQAGEEIHSIIIAFFALIFALLLVGFVLYLYIAGAFRTIHLRPFRFALYVLFFICAMTFGIGFIQQTRP